MLARKRGAPGIIDPCEAHRLTEHYRPAILAGTASFRDLIAGERLVLATELMVPFAHWITPEAMPKRFDTCFYVVAAPVEQLALHDGGEVVEGLWIAPQQALRDADAGTRTVVFPTRMNLQKLARYRTVAETVAASRSEPLVTVMPRIEQTETSYTLHIPEAAGYGVTAVTINWPCVPSCMHALAQDRRQPHLPACNSPSSKRGLLQGNDGECRAHAVSAASVCYRKGVNV